jgi:hypothetical protein
MPRIGCSCLTCYSACKLHIWRAAGDSNPNRQIRSLVLCVDLIGCFSIWGPTCWSGSPDGRVHPADHHRPPLQVDLILRLGVIWSVLHEHDSLGGSELYCLMDRPLLQYLICVEGDRP